VDSFPGHALSLTEWWHRSWWCMQTAAADAVDGHRGAEEGRGSRGARLIDA